MQGKFVLFLFCLTGSHCRPGWPGTSSVREDDLELKILSGAEITACAIITSRIVFLTMKNSSRH